MPETAASPLGSSPSPSIPRRQVLLAGAGLFIGIPGASWRGRQSTSAQSTSAVADSSPRLLWRVPIALRILDPLAVADGSLFIVGSPFESEGLGTGIVVALNAATGAEFWRAEGVRAASAPAAADGLVYVGLATGATITKDDRWRYEGSGALLALDAATGSKRWRLELPGPTGDPVIADGTVYATSVDLSTFTADSREEFPATWLVAANAASGVERWRVAVAAPDVIFPPRPAVTGGSVYALGEDLRSVVAFDAAAGSERWRTPLFGGAPLNYGPIAGGQLVAFVAGFALYALDAATGRRRWAYPSYAPEMRLDDVTQFQTPPVVADDGVYAVVDRGDGRELAAFDATTGRVRWWSDKATGLPAAADDMVYAGDSEDNLLAIDAANGVERWRLPVGGLVFASPVIAGDVIYGAMLATAEGDNESTGAVFAAVGPDA